MKTTAFGLVALVALLPACSDLHPFPIEEPAERCAGYDPLGQIYFGDLHAHTRLSFDAVSYDVRLTPADAYAFARGAEVELAPYDEAGRGTRRASLDRPLDFAAVTDHADFFGEVAHCETPGAPGYDADVCVALRAADGQAAVDFGILLAQVTPRRSVELCGEDGRGCEAAARERWRQIIDAADEANDPSPSCEFSTLVGYEYTRTPLVTNLHRNVLFASAVVPELPITAFEQPDAIGLLRAVAAACNDSGTGCDAIVIPHNANLSNGRLLYPDYGDATTPAAQAEIAALRERLEPLVEVFQHKGAGECRNGVDPALPDDPGCGYEQARTRDAEICGTEPGHGGMTLGGCVHRLEFARNVLLEGLREQQRLGVNPYRLGFIGSTDSHNGTPGHTSDDGFPGHVGIADDTPGERLGEGNATHDGFINNPGGLVAVWAPQNRRQDIFDALRRREVYATSGTRIRLQLFAGSELPADLCGRPDALAVARDRAVPMGQSLGASAALAGLQLYVRAAADLGSPERPGNRLERIQIVKGWLDAEGAPRIVVHDVAGSPALDAGLDIQRCEPVSAGQESLCAVWTDPEFDPAIAAFYYARVLEQPSCRWSQRECNTAGPDAPAICGAREIARVVHERAWSSPIWIEPGS